MMRTARLRAGASGATVIEVSIPLSTLRSGDDLQDDPTCYICANSFCATDKCGLSLTHLACCTQSICCACLVKSCKRCRCKDECDAVIALCPFCREVSPVEALDMFLGGKPGCKACLQGGESGELHARRAAVSRASENSSVEGSASSESSHMVDAVAADRLAHRLADRLAVPAVDIGGGH
jgi:hypothetical protein